MGKDSFVFYRSFFESISNLDSNIKLEIYDAICSYSLNGEVIELSPVATAIFTLIKPNIDNATKRYDASVENGKKGGRPRKNNNLEKPNENLEKPNQNLNVDVDVYEDVDVYVDKDNINKINNNINLYKDTAQKASELFKKYR